MSGSNRHWEEKCSRAERQRMLCQMTCSGSLLYVAHFSHHFIWLRHLFLNNSAQSKHNRSKYSHQLDHQGWQENVLLLFEAETAAKLFITKITVYVSQAISAVNLIEIKLLKASSF